MTKKPKRPQTLPPPHTDIGKLRMEIHELKRELDKASATQQAFAMDKAKRADQMRALLQVANLLLWVASREVGVTFREINLDKRER